LIEQGQELTNVGWVRPVGQPVGPQLTVGGWVVETAGGTADGMVVETFSDTAFGIGSVIMNK